MKKLFCLVLLLLAITFTASTTFTNYGYTDFYQQKIIDNQGKTQMETIMSVRQRMGEWIRETFNGSIVNFETLTAPADVVWKSGVPTNWQELSAAKGEVYELIYTNYIHVFRIWYNSDYIYLTDYANKTSQTNNTDFVPVNSGTVSKNCAFSASILLFTIILTFNNILQ